MLLIVHPILAECFIVVPSSFEGGVKSRRAPPLTTTLAHAGVCLQPVQTGYLSADQAASLRTASHDALLSSGSAGQSGAMGHQQFTAEDQEMQAAFGRKLSLTDSSFSAQDRRGKSTVASARVLTYSYTPRPLTDVRLWFRGDGTRCVCKTCLERLFEICQRTKGLLIGALRSAML